MKAIGSKLLLLGSNRCSRNSTPAIRVIFRGIGLRSSLANCSTRILSGTSPALQLVTPPTPLQVRACSTDKLSSSVIGKGESVSSNDESVLSEHLRLKVSLRAVESLTLIPISFTDFVIFVLMVDQPSNFIERNWTVKRCCESGSGCLCRTDPTIPISICREDELEQIDSGALLCAGRPAPGGDVR